MFLHRYSCSLWGNVWENSIYWFMRIFWCYFISFSVSIPSNFGFSLFLSMLSRASGEINNVISVVVSLHSFCLSPSSNFRNIDRHEGLLKNVTCLWPMLWITAPPNFGCYINATVLSSLNIDLVITRLVGTSKIPFFREVGAFHVIEVFSGMFIGFFFFFLLLIQYILFYWFIWLLTLDVFHWSINLIYQISLRNIQTKKFFYGNNQISYNFSQEVEMLTHHNSKQAFWK